MKTAGVTIQTVVVWCPHCADYLEVRGSAYLTSEAVARQDLRPGRTVRCASCDGRLRLPGGALRALWEAR